MNAKRFRKKPVVIEAMQWDGTEASQSRIVTWANGAVSGWFDDRYFLRIDTLEGELYPCKPDIFEATYEEVE
jgi:hypothetical protein